MDGAKTLSDYRVRLQTLLGDRAPLSTEEIPSLRAIVHQRRTGRRNRDAHQGAPHVRERANEIVALLEAAARELRPRETQELDDLVAGRLPKTGPPPSVPVRMHRSGWPPR